MIISRWRLVRATTALWFVAGSAAPVRADVPRGAAILEIHRDLGVTRRAALVVGRYQSAPIALAPEDALYGNDLSPAELLVGMVLDYPLLEVPGPGAAASIKLKAVGVRGAEVGEAACLRNVVAGTRVLVVSAAARSSTASATDPDAITLGGALVVSGTRWRVRLDERQPPASPGDPVFVKLDDNSWGAIGIVDRLAAGRDVGLQRLDAIFAALPSDHGAWGLQPHEFCLPDFARQIGRLEREVRGLEDRRAKPRDFVMWMAAVMDRLRAMLEAPGAEHYLFDRRAPLDVQRRQLYAASAVLFEGRGAMQLRSLLAAQAPIARVAASTAGAPPTMGWAVVIGLVETATGGRSRPDAVLLATAAHLVDPRGGEPAVRVYYPGLPAIPVTARVTPFLDRTIDVAIIATSADDEILRSIAAPVGRASCDPPANGPIEVPVDAASWRLDHHRGAIVGLLGNGLLRIAGIPVVQGFSGGPILRSTGNPPVPRVVGLITKSLERSAGQGVSMERILQMVDGWARPLDPWQCGPGLERRAVQAVAAALDGTPLARLTVRDLRAVFSAQDAGRIDVGALPHMEQPEPEDLLAPREMFAECGVIAGQRRTPEPGWDDAAPLDPSGQPVPEVLGCDLPLRSPGGSLPFLRSDIRVPFCRAGMKDVASGVLVEIGGAWRDGTALEKCRGLVIEHYSPPGWIGRAAALARPIETVTVAAGTYSSESCVDTLLPHGTRMVCEPNAGPGRPGWTDHFRIDRYPVTVAQVARCVQVGDCRYQLPPDSQMSTRTCNWDREGREDRAMNCITWTAADEFCRARHGRLPTDEEWEKAAGGVPERWRPELIAMWRTLGNRTMRVGQAPDLVSRYGLEDVEWHVIEWTQSPYQVFRDGKPAEIQDPAGTRVVRGTRADSGGHALRYAMKIDWLDDRLGFRCAYPAP